MNFSNWIHEHTRSVLFLIAVLALAGAASAFKLPVALFPNVSFPRVDVTVNAGDRPAQRMAVDVTYPLEEAVRAIPGVKSVRSTTSRGSAEILVNFGWGHNMTNALLQVEAEVNSILPRLPTGTTFRVKRMDPTVDPVMAYSLTSRTHSLVQLRYIAQYRLRPLLSTVPGVARVDVQGGKVREYRVEVDPAKLQSFGMTLNTVARALSASNILTAVGKMQDHDKLYLILSDTRFTTLNQISDTVLRSGTNGIVRLDNVAIVRRATVPQWVRVTADGRDAVLMQVFQQPNGNTVQIANGIKRKLARFEKTLPPGIRIANWYDQSQLILASAGSVRDAVVVGVILAAVVLLLFLRNWKITLIAIMTVPAVLATTMLLLSLLRMSFNIMTLGGMAAAVGLIIDDSIVMVEHIIRRIRGHAGDERGRVILATQEFTRPLAGSSASTIIIFAPLAFLSGVTGGFFKALSLTMAASLFISFMIAWLGVPVLAARILNEKDANQEEDGAITERIHRGYQWFMQRLLPRPWLAAALIIPLLLVGYFAYEHVSTGFMPRMDEGGFILDYVAPAGTSLKETDRMLDRVQHILATTPQVDTYSRRTGLQLGGGLTEANTGDFFVRLKPMPRPSIWKVMAAVRRRVHHSVPDLKVETDQLMEDLIGDLTAVPEPIEIKLYSNHQTLLDNLAYKVRDAIKKVPGVIEAKSGVVPAGDALDIRVNRVRAALDGLDPNEITKFLYAYLHGDVTTRIQRGVQMIGVRVWVPKADRKTELDIGRLEMRAPNGHLVPLNQVATIRTVTGQPEIDRDNLKRMVAVTGRIKGGNMGAVIARVKKTLKTPGLIPAGVYYTLGGMYKQQQIAFRGLVTVMVAAVVLVFLLLLFLYERFRVALAMLATPLLALAAVMTGLFLTGTQLNITAMMGMTMVVGIVTEVAIFYYSEYHDLPGEMPAMERLIVAGKNRMRPIAMTTVAAILALLPLALGVGAGSAMQQPLAIAIISGLIVQLPLTLVILPTLLVLFRSARLDGRHPERVNRPQLADFSMGSHGHGSRNGNGIGNSAVKNGHGHGHNHGELGPATS